MATPTTAPSTPPLTPLYIPLAKHDRILIDDFTSTFDDWNPSLPEGIHSPSFVFTFTHWTWTRRYYEALGVVLADDEWIKFHQGRGDEVWASVERVLPQETTRSEAFRFGDLKTANIDKLTTGVFVEDLELVPVPCDEDASYWVTLINVVEFYLNSEPVFSRPDSGAISPKPFMTDYVGDLDERELERTRVQQWTFDVWSMLRACAAILRRDYKSLQKSMEGVRLTGFYELHDPVLNGHVRNTKRRSSSKALDYGYQVTYKGLRLISFGEEPSKFVEYIPWEQLDSNYAPRSTEELGQQEIVVWRPTKLMPWEKHLYTEDDTMRACIESGTFLPGYHVDQGIGFLLTPITAFTIETGADGGFWGHWNDCAITHDAVKDQWYLLQTIPGLQFRQLYQTRNPRAAVRYFRSLVDQKLCGRTTTLMDALGLDFKPHYENLLTMIPFNQIAELNPEPIGEGARGVVFQALWSQPEILGIRKGGAVDVAIKSIKVQGTDDMAKFIAELDATFTAVVGSAVHVLELLGVTKTPSRQAMEARNLPANLPHDTLFLVLEYATMGKFDTYMCQKYAGQEHEWPLLIDTMAEIALGVMEIHDRKVIHRDIHWNNVLVGIHDIKGEAGPVLRQDVILLGDLGEGQIITGQMNHRTYYGNPDFWAPEVKQNQEYSFASDVYALGCLFYQMLLLHWELGRSFADADVQHGVPKVVIDLVYACLQKDRHARPEAREVLHVLENLGIDIEAMYEENEAKLEMVSITKVQLDNLLAQHLAEEGSSQEVDDIPD